MSGAREEILLRVRRAIGKVPGNREEDYLSIAWRSDELGLQTADELFGLFEERLIDYGSTTYRCSPGEIAATVAQALNNRGLTGLLVPTAVPSEWLPSGFEFVRNGQLTYQQMDASPGVLTGCAAAIALTGTIILRHSNAEGQRALTLIPDYHLCIVQAEQVVYSVPEAFERARAFATAPITTISGSSATSDIEMTLVKGVHGPRTLDVILVSAS